MLDGDETLRVAQSHHHGVPCKVSWPSDTECETVCAQIAKFLLCKYIGSLHKNWRFGCTRSDSLCWIEIKLCTWLYPITMESHAKFHGHLTPNVRLRAPKSYFFLCKYVGSLHKNWRFGPTQSYGQCRMEIKNFTWLHIIAMKGRAKCHDHPTPNKRLRASKPPILYYANT